MSVWQWGLLLGLGVALLLYAALIVALLCAGRREDARALAGFIPDCLVLVRRLLSDPRVARKRKLLLVALVGYLALPFDLVPDFVPVVGLLDDAIVAAVVLRVVLRSAGPDLLREHWAGPPASLRALLRFSYGGEAS
jgi:uncharacterized membrane protein YkvA (DUF1232 family)